MTNTEICRYCDQTIIRAEDGAWEDVESSRSGCGQAPPDGRMEHEPTFTHYQHYQRVRWNSLPSHHIVVLADEGALVYVEDHSRIWDYDDDGLDDEGAPIMRPLYERYRVPREQLEAL